VEATGKSSPARKLPLPRAAKKSSPSLPAGPPGHTFMCTQQACAPNKQAQRVRTGACANDEGRLKPRTRSCEGGAFRARQSLSKSESTSTMLQGTWDKSSKPRVQQVWQLVCRPARLGSGAVQRPPADPVSSPAWRGRRSAAPLRRHSPTARRASADTKLKKSQMLI